MKSQEDELNVSILHEKTKDKNDANFDFLS